MSEISRVYVDMDGVLTNFNKRYYLRRQQNPENKYPQMEYGFFLKLEEIEGSVKGINRLSRFYDTWILTAPSTKNPLCYTEKRVWVEEHLGEAWVERLIISPNKGLLNGEHLIDDQPWPNFKGNQILFGSPEFPNWTTVLKYLKID